MDPDLHGVLSLRRDTAATAADRVFAAIAGAPASAVIGSRRSRPPPTPAKAFIGLLQW
jgi:hypothetical protein